MPTNVDLVAQLNGLLRLTETEIMIAESRRAQAATDEIERELASNADEARQRVRLLTETIRDLGGVPDAVGVAAGRLAATAKTAFEQGQDYVEALFGDLALEHQLLDRARFARMIAEDQGATPARRVLERLERAHAETIEWLLVRLGEVAVGGPPALRPSPVQIAVGAGQRLSVMPVVSTAQVVNRSLDAAGRLRRQLGDTISTNVDRTRQLVDAAGEIWTAGRDASLERTEVLAERRGDRRTARRVRRTRRELGALDASELPIRNYDSLTVEAAVGRIERLREADDARAVLAYESAHKQRKGVVAAARQRVEELAAELAGVS